MTALLVRDDTLDALLIESWQDIGAEWLRSELVDHPLPSRSEVVDHLYRRPRTFTIRAMFAEVSLDPSVRESGAARYFRVIDWLTRARDEGAVCTFFAPDRPGVGNLLVVGAREQQGKLARMVLDIELREAQFSSVQTVQLDVVAPIPSPVAGQADGPAPDLAAGLAAEDDAGSRSTSLLVSIGTSLGLL